MRYLLLVILFCSCANIHYNFVAKNDPSPRNKKILLQKCDVLSPPTAPQFIRGKDSLRIDTVTNLVTSIETINDTVFITRLQTNTVTKTINRVDTFKTENNVRLTLANDLNTELQIKNGVLAAEVVSANKEVKEKQGTILKFLIAFLVSLAGNIFLTYLKFRK